MIGVFLAECLQGQYFEAFLCFLIVFQGCTLQALCPTQLPLGTSIIILMCKETRRFELENKSNLS